jgi:MFS family permease
MLDMMTAFRSRVGESARAFRGAFSNANIRRLVLADAGSTIGAWTYSVAVAVFAFEKGGANEVALVWIIRTIPAGLASPFFGLVADRYSRKLVMLTSDLGRAVLTLVVATMMWEGAPPISIYLLVGVITLIGRAFDPASAAMLPNLAETPEELTAANVTASTIDSVGYFAGPALGGILLAVASPPAVVALTAILILWSALFVSLIRPPQAEAVEEAAVRPAAESPGASERILAGMIVGFKTVGTNQRLAIIVGLFGAVSLVLGATEVLIVNIAIDLLHLHQSGVGYLNAAFGVGALIGALVAAGFVGIRRLSIPFLVGAILIGIPLALLAVSSSTGLALVYLGALGLGNTILDVAGFTLLQRAVPEKVLARVWGVLGLTLSVAFGVGAAIAPALLAKLSLRETLAVLGASVPALAILLGRRLIAIDTAATAPAADRIDLLRRTPIFAPLAGTTLERLAGQLIPLSVPAGHVLIRQGDPGDRFYVLAKGMMEVTADGKAVATIGPGDYTGEIALLRDVPRTATVTSTTACEAYALSREDFLGAVTSHVTSQEAAESAVSSRLAGLHGATGRLPIPRG